LVPIVVTVFALWRTSPSGARRLMAIVGLASGLGVVAVARTIGGVFDYRLRWSWVLGMLTFLTAAWLLWARVARRPGRLETRWIVPLALAALAGLAGVNSVGAAMAPMPFERDTKVLSALMKDALPALPDREGDVIVRSDDFLSVVYQGIFLQLERSGVRARTDQPRGILGSGAGHRVHRRGPVRAVLIVTTGDALNRSLTRSDLELAAYWGAPSPGERARRMARLSELDDAHARGALDDAAWYAERVALTKPLGTAAVGVFLERPRK
jgi:hypothetical protein